MRLHNSVCDSSWEDQSAFVYYTKFRGYRPSLSHKYKPLSRQSLSLLRYLGVPASLNLQFLFPATILLLELGKNNNSYVLQYDISWLSSLTFICSKWRFPPMVVPCNKWHSQACSRSFGRIGPQLSGGENNMRVRWQLKLDMENEDTLVLAYC